MSEEHGGTAYSLRADVTTFAPRKKVTWIFEVLGPHGRPRSYRIQHERELHLIIVRDDLSTFSHLHPMRRDDGRWTVELAFPSPGPYTVFADIAPEDAPAMTLKLPLKVEGEWAAEPRPSISKQSQTDGYSVTIQGDILGSEASEIQFQITKDGAPVVPEPYLGAGGHLVALRVADLEYLHVHPLETTSGGAIGFMMHAPGPGTYRLFLQFLHDGAVRTVDFTVDAEGSAAESPHRHSDHHA